jgi:hypothetical protein
MGVRVGRVARVPDPLCVPLCACVRANAGSKTLKDAINEAMRDWVTNVDTTHYLVGSAIGPHPFPTIVRDFQSVIGRETRAQVRRRHRGGRGGRWRWHWRWRWQRVTVAWEGYV